MSKINERIAAVVEASNLSKTAFALRINVTQQHVSRLCTSGNPSDRTISDICREFNVDEYWLRTGEGEMFVTVSEDEELAAYVGHVLGGRDSDLQRSIISFMSKLPPETWEVIEAKAREVLNSRTETEKEEQT